MRGAVAALLMLAGVARADDLRVLDDFRDLAAWTVTATDDVKAALRAAPGPNGESALCIDYDFGQVTGYVSARRRLPIELPPRYEFSLTVRGNAPPNHLQFKLDDASGENVWWGRRLDYRFPPDWTALKFRQRQIEFAWGPTADRSLRRAEAIELVIASGSGAGQGSACFDRLGLRTLPPVAPPLPTPQPIADRRGVDFGQPREFDALALRWPPGREPHDYAIETSDDAVQWRRVREVTRARGAGQVHWLPDSETRFVRIVPGPDGAPVAALDAIEPRAAASIDAVFAQLARTAPLGRYPRAWLGEQAYWTVLGVDGGRVASLLGEDGALEPVPGVGALEPYLIVDGRVVSWADVQITQTLRDDVLPMPSVHWRFGDLALDIEAFGDGTPDAAQVLVRYVVRNLGTAPRAFDLALAWRPFQVNPPTQFLANPGGAAAVRTLAWDGQALRVDGVSRVRPLAAPASVRIEPLAAGPVGDWLGEADPQLPQALTDPAGYASAALRFPIALAPGAAREIAVALPVAGTRPPLVAAEVADEAERVAAHWHAQLDRVVIHGPPAVEELARNLRAALGQILVNRSGPALQPGARAYARSWIRDGALTSAALLRLGHADGVRDFLRWYATFQFASGKVPCCATARGADPVPENDSDGEFAYAVTELWRYTGDAATARTLWPHVRAAIGHQEALRQSERTERNREPGRSAYFGLMPPSISHEGYSDKPAYSYWDDFWAATGYRSAAELAEGLGESDDAARIGRQRDAFDADLRHSIEASTRRHGLDLLPGSADRGDIDPTSSTIALSPGGWADRLPDQLVGNTFARWWRDFEARRADEALGIRHGDGAYTPYEWRNVGALLRLGERDRALEAMAYFNRDRRPPGWRQWAEVVARDAREPRFIGDMPHGWVASDQIRAVLDLFAYEDEGVGRLVLAAGVPLEWLRENGVAIDGLRTPYGRLAWHARLRVAGPRHVVDFSLAGLASGPPGGIAVRGPWPADAHVRVDGRWARGPANDVRLARAPARLRIEWTEEPGRQKLVGCNARESGPSRRYLRRQ